MAFDLVIKNGTIVDGSGQARYRADVGVKDGRIAEIGRIRENGAESIDADGMIVAPGFIDGHTHMDAQVTWDPLGSCSCWHGVTSVMMGNCGFALAPCKPEDREWYARCLEAVEDIPTEAIMSGVSWDWETFPEYLDAVGRAPKALNHGSYIGHSALRMYVMGKRALDQEATEDDVAKMAAMVADAIQAGALGFSTSRSPTHVTPDDTPVASRIGGWDEIDRLVAPMTELNAGIFQLAPDVTSGASQEAFFEQVRRIALESGRPIMFGTIASRQGKDPKPWQFHTKYLDETVAMGGRMYGQATTRSINALFSLKSNLPFDLLPTWKEVRALPLEEQKRRLADPETRGKLIAEEAQMKPRGFEFQGGGAATTNPLRPDYTNLIVMQGVDWDDPTVDDLARSANKNPVETMIDLMLANEDQIFIQPLVNENPEDVLGLLKHPRTLATFSDSGAHVCQEMGSSLPTHLLNYWVRLRQEFTLEEGIRMLTFDNASAWELPDRGLVRAGFAADLVIFDENGIKPAMPTVAADLPGGAKRLIQKAEGIAATVVNGAVTFVNGESTGNYPGQLIKGRLAS
ncbi:MAG: amidohydrolase family protein [Rhodospirillaceae bacterium]|jgi:N-acyl-D-amino-acid deacylase|nr:amidohydrolase family protein [Rhodospirillaceae bacterium]MBT5083112.1 amidohydrolase family protein [Rhodospirillaceae bacterium]MBT5526126.1 amidohydrolase family protein [Rhodospirillaceae bacterium]MBT5879655.1 amidohydrolase family protein [Rhodospirillaceae bacterium]MBT6587931.1 amidohydrolase family protein [Rhodospirillaceae bacterium]